MNAHRHDDLDRMLREAARLLREHHVSAEAGGTGARMLESAAVAQRYRHARGSPAQLAELVTADLRRATGDQHLYLEHVRKETASQDGWIARWRAQGPAENWGVQDVRLLAGNIALVRISSFHTYDLAARTLSAAMELVRHSAGLILDLTGNGGGDERTADAVTATFLDERDPGPLRIEARAGIEEPRPPLDLAWPRYGTSRPLAIVIDRATFSAPEAVAYALQQEQRALIVGGRSAGGANMIDDAFAPAPGFALGISTRRPVGRTTGSNWEGVGVRPEVEARGDAALWLAWEAVRSNPDREPTTRVASGMTGEGTSRTGSG